MPTPIILLENHVLTDAKSFLKNNAKRLATRGYKELLLEVSVHYDFEALKKGLAMAKTSVPVGSYEYDQADSFLAMLKALEQNGIKITPIDPINPSEDEAINEKSRLASISNNKADLQMALAERTRSTKARDEIMAKTFLNRSSLHSGGVLYLGGYCHNHLVKLLDKAKAGYFRYICFSDTDEIMMHLSMKKLHMFEPELEITKGLPSEKFREVFYGVDSVEFTNSKVRLDYDLLEGPHKVIEPTEAGKALSKASGTDFKFTADKYCRVAATAELNERDTKRFIDVATARFKGLTFFTERHDDDRFRVKITELNFPNNIDVISKGMGR